MTVHIQQPGKQMSKWCNPECSSKFKARGKSTSIHRAPPPDHTWIYEATSLVLKTRRDNRTGSGSSEKKQQEIPLSLPLSLLLPSI
ncbi:Hypothetical predicted protein [Podarcis lilfordi]|uniref:Uncharacterized protein n=1 Tax=Podarcis lilfordi TaxID=74358 RepID=A0AA35NUE7_9SAUR|nr:Hypothetical predicted protein [Podarcis lilfordi]